MIPKPLETAVLFLVFNRPKLTAIVFESIRKAKPPRLYLASDGARADHVGELEKVSKVRQISTSVDWPCKVITLFREENLGCKQAVSSAISWFFQQEEQGIILEDDCLPSQTFYRYCELLLNYYKHDYRVMAVTGTNITHGITYEADYWFSKYALMWGWASWRRAWKMYDGELTSWPNTKKENFLKQRSNLNAIEIKKWKTILDRTFCGDINTWDYQWIYSCLINQGLTAAPAVNLVRNIGYGDDATHTTIIHPILSSLATSEMTFPISHPSEVETNIDADKFISRHWFDISWRSHIISIMLKTPGITQLNQMRKSLSSGIKTKLKQAVLAFGWDVHPSRPDPHSIQILATLNHVHVNIVFDVGANAGQFAQKLRSAGYSGKLVSFEPLARAHEQLRLAAGCDTNWLVHQRVAIGDLDGETNINVSANLESSSILPMLSTHLSAAPHSVYVSTEPTPVVRLDSIAAQYLTVDSRLFIKVDAQGYEQHVLNGSLETLRYAHGVLLELSLVPLYEGQCLWYDMINFMEREGFTLWGIQKGFTHPTTGRTLQIDVIFLRE
jgi:FkbM family methyltransferase